MGEPVAMLTLLCAALAVVLLLVQLLRIRPSAGADPDVARRELRDELRSAREEARLSARELREEVTKSIDATQASLDRVRVTLDQRVRELQEGNERKLDEMRRTVDEKLHDTLEKRLGESFKLVSDRLDTVHKGLGEMQQLATGVGDLKRVLTNVKARGTWAEVQLGAILEQVLTPEQYGKNVCIRPDTAERVEFAVRLPGPLDDPTTCVWLPIDSKFPQEDWLRLQDASDQGDVAAVQDVGTEPDGPLEHVMDIDEGEGVRRRPRVLDELASEASDARRGLDDVLDALVVAWRDAIAKLRLGAAP